MNPGKNFHPSSQGKQTGKLAKLVIVVSVLFTSSLYGQTGYGQTEVFRARLSPMPTTPQTVTEILGEGEAILSLSGNTLSVTGKFMGMSSAATSAHIHNGPPAQPGPVIHTLTISPANSGELSAELDLSDVQVAQLKANSFYIQIHSETNPGGELRGWVFLRSHFE